MSVDAFSRQVGVGTETLRDDVIKSIQEKLGKIAFYRHTSWVTDSLSLGQQEILLEELDRLGMICDPPSAEYPETTRDTMRDVFRVKRERIDNAITALEEQQGPRKRFIFHKTRDEGFDPWQQNMVYDWLWDQHYVRPQPPETVLSVATLAEWLGLTDKVIKRVIHELGDRLGETKEYKFISQISPGYDPWQQDDIRDHLIAQHNFAPDAPDDVWTAKRICREWGVSTGQVYGAIEELGGALGEKDYYRIGGKPSVCFGEAKRGIIRQYLVGKGVQFKEAA